MDLHSESDYIDYGHGHRDWGGPDVKKVWGKEIKMVNLYKKDFLVNGIQSETQG